MEFPDIKNPEALKLTISDTDLVVEIVNLLSGINDADIKIIIPESEVHPVQRNFPLNSKIAELVKQSRLSLYSTREPLETLVINRDDVYNLIRVGTVEQFVKSQADDAATAVNKEFHRISETAEPVDVDISPWSDLLAQLEESVDAKTRKEFERLIEAARIENLGALDDISVAIVAAAQSGALLYDLGTWAEDVGLASKATFSRRKKKLEEDNIIYTEKVPVDVGRPRLRLKLAENISAVRIEGEEVDISRNENWTKQSTPTDKSDSKIEAERGREARTEHGEDETEQDENEILTTIEQEVRDAISSN